MGCCGSKEDREDARTSSTSNPAPKRKSAGGNFSQPGRVLGTGAGAANTSSHPQPPTQAQAQAQTSTQPGRAQVPQDVSKDGGVSTDAGKKSGRGAGSAGGAGAAGIDREAAARAAEARLAKAKTTSPKGKGGKLSQQLEADKKKSHAQILNEASKEERDARRMDANEEVRRWE